MGAEILRKLVQVQHSILVGVPGLHDLKTQTARAGNEKRISGQLGDMKVIQKIGCKHKYFIKDSLKLNMPVSYCSESCLVASFLLVAGRYCIYTVFLTYPHQEHQISGNTPRQLRNTTRSRFALQVCPITESGPRLGDLQIAPMRVSDTTNMKWYRK